MIRVRNLALEILVPLSLIGIWWWRSSDSTSAFYPPLKDMFQKFKDTYIFDRFGEDVVPSVMNLAAGMFIAIAAGIAIGLVIGLSPRFRRALGPTLEFLRAVPIVALLPAFIIVLGVGSTMEVSIIAFAAFWPILLNVVDGVRATDSVALDTARAYGLSRWSRIRVVVWHSMMPQLFAGIRVGLAAGVALMVVSNMFGSTQGLGHAVIETQQTFDILGAWAGIFIIGLVGVAASLVLALVQHRVLGWHRGWRSASVAK